MKRLRYMVSTLCILLCTVSLPIQGQSAFYPPLIQVPITVSEISASGRYLAGFEYITTQEELAAEFERTNQLPDFTYRIGLWENSQDGVAEVANMTFETPLLTDTVPIFGFAFSPDQTALAIREDVQIRVLRLPTLETETIIPVPIGQPLFVQDLAWSSDSRYLAFIDESLALAVWDRQSHNVVYSSLQVQFDGPITPIDDGWIVQFAVFSPLEDTRVFQACDLLLTDCRIYETGGLNVPFVYRAVQPAPDGSGVLAVSEDGTLWWWARVQAAEYITPTEPLTEINSAVREYPPFFSQDGAFVAVPNRGENGEPQLDVYEVGTWTPAVAVYPTWTAGFVPNANALIWWDYTKNVVASACTGQPEAEQISTPAEETVIMASFQFAATGEFVLIKNGSVEATSNLLLHLPEMNC